MNRSTPCFIRISTTILMILANGLTAKENEGNSFRFLNGDHVSIIGNTLADRMQHDGWVETFITAGQPAKQLSFRNLGFSGDELTLRLRSANFGSPDSWLTRHKTDVIFAFFGYNESFGDKEGLLKFKRDLAEFIKNTLSQKYNGKSSPRLVIFSPIAHEKLETPNLPDGKENNRRLEMYTRAMAEVSQANHVPFVDLFHPTLNLYRNKANKGPFTINGIHLNENGNRELAQIIHEALLGPVNGYDNSRLESIRKAVKEKNFYWFQRYRTTDGYSVFGGRADLQFVRGQTNREVAQREMQILDVMTANRDKKIWSVAKGGEDSPDDTNTPPFIPVETNKPGPLPGGKHLFLDAEKAIEKMTVAPGMKVNLFASEKDFPELVNPVQMTFDTKGRLWVAVWPTYPHWKPKEPMNDKILVIEDLDGDGKADKCTVFADRLNCPTGFELNGKGVFVAQCPDLWYLEDSDGDGRADIRKRMLHGLDSADTHHASNSFTLDPGGALYFQEGTFHHTQVETPWGPSVRCANAGVFRYEPRSQKFGVYVSYGFANPHGHVFDRWGRDIVIDGTGSNPYDAALFSGHLEFPNKHRSPPQVWQPRTRPCPGMEVLSSRHFPQEMQNHVLVANVIGFHGILRYKIEEEGGSFIGREQQPLLSSTDPNFRPTDLKIAPDGSLYFVDWHNPIIGHMQHNLRDPSRDREHGRIYRLTYSGNALLKPTQIEGKSIEQLLELMKTPEDRVRYRVRIELGKHDSEKVGMEIAKWLESLKPSEEDFDRLQLEGLWLLQAHNVVNPKILKIVLSSKNPLARAAATRIISYWHDRLPDALDLLRTQAADSHPRVRLEAVRAASFLSQPEAMEVVLIATEKPQDRYIEFVREETMRALQPIVKKAIAEGKKIQFTTSTGARYFLRNVSTDDLLKMERSPALYLELLFRNGVRDEFRREALSGLAKHEGKSEAKVLLDAIKDQDSMDRSGDQENVLFDLARLLTSRPQSELQANRETLEKLATSARQPIFRELGFVSLIAADGSFDKAWELAKKSANNLNDFVRSIPMIGDPVQRSSLFPQVAGLIEKLPKELSPEGDSQPSHLGRFIRIELPGKYRTLTLAEVEVFSEGENVARKGQASQSSTGFGANAKRAIDGNRSGSFADGGQTHSEEGVTNPWWELDLGREVPIQSVVVYNRTDGNLGSRLNNFCIRVLDSKRREVYSKEKNAAPKDKTSLVIGKDSPLRRIRRAAMLAIPTMRGREIESVNSISRLLKDEVDRSQAISALQRIPPQEWPKEKIRPVIEDLLSYVRKVPIMERTQTEVIDALQLADSLSVQLSPDQAQSIRKELSELGVRVVRLGTVIEQMRYDQDRIVVQAGKPFEIVFENTDTMPHNLVFVKPGSLEEIGDLAEKTGSMPGAMDRGYVPVSPKILLGSNLIQPRQTQRISWTAPSSPGVYPFVCTYPGHWRRMNGAMYVVADLEAYIADPEGYLNRTSLKISDELLKFNRPRKEWKWEELEMVTKKLENRSFSNGKQMFTVGSCISCHKFAGLGQEYGPDLTKMDPKWGSQDILKHILEPSLKIDDKYRTWTFQMDNGKTVTGMILGESSEQVQVIENPLSSGAKPITIKKAEVENRIKSPNSMMPKGLLDRMTKEEILDLLGYIISGGNPKHAVFQNGHFHGHN